MVVLPLSLGRASLELALSAAICLILLWLLLPLAYKIGLLDHPKGRKDHDEPTATIGGIAIWGSIFLTIAWFSFWSSTIIAFMGAAGLLILIGMLDDLYDLPWWVRVIAQCAAVLVMIYGGGVVVQHIGGLFGVKSTGLGVLSVPFTMFAAVGVINAINMIDGVDGLAGGIVLAALSMLGCAAIYCGNFALANPVLIFAGAVLGFLLMNMRFPWQPRARVFMGNAGSVFLGFTIAWVSFRLTQSSTHPVTPILAPWLVATPLIDCISLMVHRLMRRQSPFRADREHMHHLMLDAGFTPAQLTMTLVVVNLLLGLSASVALYAKVPQPVLVLVFVGLCIGYFWLTMRRERTVTAFAALNRGMTLLRLKPKAALIQSSSAGSD